MFIGYTRALAEKYFVILCFLNEIIYNVNINILKNANEDKRKLC